MPAVSRDSASTRLSTPNGESFIRIGPTVLLLLLRIGVPCSSLLPRGGCAPQKPESPSSSSSTSVVPKKVKISAEELERLRLGRHWHGRLGTHLGDAVRSFARATRLSV